MMKTPKVMIRGTEECDDYNRMVIELVSRNEIYVHSTIPVNRVNNIKGIIKLLKTELAKVKYDWIADAVIAFNNEFDMDKEYRSCRYYSEYNKVWVQHSGLRYEFSAEFEEDGTYFGLDVRQV